jgi:Asp-tRNA(Asn)/Glu-tRNA(Gln) amidotransferase A subunit family amidase
LGALTSLCDQINCLHEIFFEEALSRAEKLDRYLDEHGRTVGALHGLPVSLKDQFHVKGVDTTMGYIGWIGTYEGHSDPDKVHKVESQVVSELYLEGAVPYCKVRREAILIACSFSLCWLINTIVQTSLPQTLMVRPVLRNLDPVPDTF